MSKKCIHCGAEVVDNASFCPHCTTELVEKQSVKLPKIWRKKFLMVLMVVGIFAVGVLLIMVLQKPKTYEGGAEIIYKDKGETYHVLLGDYSKDSVPKEPLEEREVTLATGSAGFPSMLYVYKEGTDDLVWEEFLEKVESYHVEAKPLDGAVALERTEPAHKDIFPLAVLECDFAYTTECGTNEIWWTLNMKNGDTIRLKQNLTVIKQKAVFYSSEDTVMDTTEDLQKVIDKIEEEVDDDAVVYLYLPAVHYEEDLVLKDRCYLIYGSDNEGQRTTFKGNVKLESKRKSFSEICGIDFEGSGGTGINSYGNIILVGCKFTGWDLGIMVQNGAWVVAKQCVFEKNGVGLKFDTVDAQSVSLDYNNNVFAENEVAVWIERSVPNMKLNFVGSTFSKNRTDIKNQNEYPVDLSAAILDKNWGEE